MAARLGWWLAALVLATGSAVTSFGAVAQERTRSDGAPPTKTGLQWLESIQQAAVRVNYSGTIVYQAGSEMHTSRITHLFDGKSSHERVQTLDGKPREFIRLRTESNDEVRCLIPESRRIVVEHRALDEPFPGLLGAPAAAILEHYQLRIGDVERVAGTECQVLLLEPRDMMRFGYRLCVDRSTGLLLNAQTLGEQGDVLEQVAFTDVKIGDHIDSSRLKPSWPTDGWKVERSDYRRIDIQKAGWIVPTPEGFRLSKQVQRRIGSGEAIQVVFSDGLATLSVFIESNGGGKGEADDERTMGSTSVYTRRVADALITVIGEVPAAAVRAVAKSVEFRGPR